MTNVEITIKDGKVTWVDQSGDELPNDVWEKLNIKIKEIEL
jgi:hypothetical protein